LRTAAIDLQACVFSDQLWSCYRHAGPDIITSILLTGGKIPHLEKAIRVVPHGKQAGLGSTFLRSMVRVDASTDGFFKHVIEQRAANESNAALHYWLKILANSNDWDSLCEDPEPKVPWKPSQTSVGVTLRVDTLIWRASSGPCSNNQWRSSNQVTNTIRNNRSGP
jgi:hypothetical protein